MGLVHLCCHQCKASIAKLSTSCVLLDLHVLEATYTQLPDRISWSGGAVGSSSLKNRDRIWSASWTHSQIIWSSLSLQQLSCQDLYEQPLLFHVLRPTLPPPALLSSSQWESVWCGVVCIHGSVHGITTVGLILISLVLISSISNFCPLPCSQHFSDSTSAGVEVNPVFDHYLIPPISSGISPARTCSLMLHNTIPVLDLILRLFRIFRTFFRTFISLYYHWIEKYS